MSTWKGPALAALGSLLAGLLAAGTARSIVPPMVPIMPVPPLVVSNLPLDGTFPINGAFALQSPSGTPALFAAVGEHPTALLELRTYGSVWNVIVPEQALALGAEYRVEVPPTWSRPFTTVAACALDFSEVALVPTLTSYNDDGPRDACCAATASMPEYCVPSTQVDLPLLSVQAMASSTASATCLSQYWMRAVDAIGVRGTWDTSARETLYAEAAEDEYCLTLELIRVSDGASELRELCVPHGALELETRGVQVQLRHEFCSAPPPEHEADFCDFNEMDCNRLNPFPTCEDHRARCGWPPAQVSPTSPVPPVANPRAGAGGTTSAGTTGDAAGSSASLGSAGTGDASDMLPAKGAASSSGGCRAHTGPGSSGACLGALALLLLRARRRR